MRKLLLSTLAAGLLIGSAATANAAPGIQDDLDAIRDAGIAGVLAEVDTGPRTFAARSGVARLGSDRPVPYGSHVRVGSNTKTFVSVVVLQLVDERRMSLDDTVEHWLPGVVTGNGNDGSKVTVRQLLQNTSGLYDFIRDINLFDEAAYHEYRFQRREPAEVVASAMAHPPVFEPGTSWDYSNTNYVLAGMIIGKVTGNDWSNEVNKRIIKPLGLRHTAYLKHDPYLPWPHARGYTAVGGAQPFDSTELNPSLPGAAAGLVSTPPDLMRFWQALLGGKLLPADRMADMRGTTVPAWPGSGIEYGLGIMRVPTSCGIESWGHSGDVPGFATRVGFTPDGKRGIVIAETTQTAHGPAERPTATAIDHVVCA